MLDHLFDIDGNAKTAFEKFDFAAQEMRIDGQVVWKKNRTVEEVEGNGM